MERRPVSKAMSWLAVVGGISACLMMASTVINSFSRYILNYSIPAVVEINEYLLLALAFTAFGWTQAKDRHVNMDFVIIHLSPGWKWRFDLFASILVLAMMTIFVIATFQAAVASTQTREITQSVIDLPKWIIMWFMPLGSLGMLLVVLEHLAGKIRGTWPVIRR